MNKIDSIISNIIGKTRQSQRQSFSFPQRDIISRNGYIKNGFAYLYHGTDAKNLESIKRHGLIKQPSAWGKEEGVFLAPNKLTAQQYANKTPTGVILKVKVPLNELAHINREDILDNKHPLKQILVKSSIPGSNISVVKTTNGNNIYDKWLEENRKLGLHNIAQKTRRRPDI